MEGFFVTRYYSNYEKVFVPASKASTKEEAERFAKEAGADVDSIDCWYDEEYQIIPDDTKTFTEAEEEDRLNVDGNV